MGDQTRTRILNVAIFVGIFCSHNVGYIRTTTDKHRSGPVLHDDNIRAKFCFNGLCGSISIGCEHPYA